MPGPPIMSKLPRFKSRFFLAPMSGITDPAFRVLCRRLGAGLTTTELTSVHAIAHKEKHGSIRDYIKFSDEESPRAIQLFGNDIDMICRAAKAVEPYFDIIDFNMGCPADHITAQQAGAALLDKPDHVQELFSRLVESVQVPITVKLRAGITSESSHLFKDIARLAQDNGVSMITLHARTLKQGYSGNAHWEWIKELKHDMDVPVVGNGDVRTPQDAKRMFDETGCDHVMIGRAAMGNPYIFKQCNDFMQKGSFDNLTNAQKVGYFFDYLDMAADFDVSYARIKDHAVEYTRGIEGGASIRREISSSQNIEELKPILRKIR